MHVLAQRVAVEDGLGIADAVVMLAADGRQLHQPAQGIEVVAAVAFAFAQGPVVVEVEQDVRGVERDAAAQPVDVLVADAVGGPRQPGRDQALELIHVQPDAGRAVEPDRAAPVAGDQVAVFERRPFDQSAQPPERGVERAHRGRARTFRPQVGQQLRAREVTPLPQRQIRKQAGAAASDGPRLAAFVIQGNGE